MELAVQITIFRPGPGVEGPQRYRWFRMLWRKLLRKPPEPGSPLFKAILDARTLGIWTTGCDHDVCFCRYGDGGGVVAGGLRYLGFRIIPDVVDVTTL
jgi:hypothetical protein